MTNRTQRGSKRNRYASIHPTTEVQGDDLTMDIVAGDQAAMQPPDANVFTGPVITYTQQARIVPPVIQVTNADLHVSIGASTLDSTE